MDVRSARQSTAEAGDFREPGMELMRKKAKEAKDPEREWNCKRLSALLRAFQEAQTHESFLHASLFRENIDNKLATEGTDTHANTLRA